ncbi:hypothetical protein DM01DRAFT_1406100 [Hesseltinella vesiculosa]|uniref:Uncharacterized protein n=1 Tax=Hesseltinella vesiculosa TaxID=101127 RepID=A0A1X2GN52_9FUNG|nr:hypothetical protein DM01DRAFT_1406100 [Hesseltinella vesiculosa]
MPLSRAKSSVCPQCSSQVQEYWMHLDTSISMCENVKCDYPFNQPDAMTYIVEKTADHVKRSQPRSEPLLNAQKMNCDAEQKATPPRPAASAPLITLGLALPNQCSSQGTLAVSKQLSLPTPSPITGTNYTLMDIADLLNDDDTTSSSTAVTPKDEEPFQNTLSAMDSLDTMAWLDGLCDQVMPDANIPLVDSLMATPLFQ